MVAHNKPMPRQSLLRHKILVFVLSGILPFATVPEAAWALPHGGLVMTGRATLSFSTNRLLINQSTARASFFWSGFNVGTNQTVQFKTPGVSSVSMNFIGGTGPARISGHVVSNGILEFMDANGLVFGSGSTVNAAGVRAYGSATSGGPLTGPVTNDGTLAVSPGGSIALAGISVNNSGTITAPSGTVVLAAGSTVTLTSTERSSLSVAVTGGGAVTDSGVIRAENTDGSPGTIVLQSGMESGTTTLPPTAVIDASAPNGGTGGTITINGAKVVLDETAPLNVSSALGTAGTVTIDPTVTQVGTASALEAIDQSQGTYVNNAAVCIELTANIDLGGYSWTPLGARNTSDFIGTLNGQGYTVSGYTVTATSSNGTGFIGYLGSGGTVKNLGVAGTVIGGSYDNIGGVVGHSSAGTVDSSWNAGDVTGYMAVGGVVGCNGGNVIHSWNTGAVSASYAMGGGVTGWNNGGSASYDWNTGSVSGSTSIGGITGCTTTTISYSWNAGSVTGSSVVGGIVGSVTPGGSVSNSYNTGSILATSSLSGGIVGLMLSFVAVNNVYNTGTVAGPSDVGGVIGAGNYAGGTYFNATVETPGITATDSGACGGVALKEGTGTGQLGNSGSYSGWNFASGWNGNGFSTPGTWTMGTVYPNKGLNGSVIAPILVADLPVDTVTVQGGSSVYSGKSVTVPTGQTLTLGGQALSSGISASAGPAAGTYSVTPSVTLSLPSTQMSVGSYAAVPGIYVITQPPAPQPQTTRSNGLLTLIPPPLLDFGTYSSFSESPVFYSPPSEGAPLEGSLLSGSDKNASDGNIVDEATLP